MQGNSRAAQARVGAARRPVDKESTNGGGKMIRRRSDGSVETVDGRLPFISIDYFLDAICRGDSCFICGASQAATAFNNEHIIPKWILKKFDLFSKRITLPNGEAVRYRAGFMKLARKVTCDDEESPNGRA